MQLEQTQAPIAEDEREELPVKKHVNIAPGTKIIVGGVAVLAGLMVLYGVAMKVGLIGGADAPATKHQGEAEATSAPPKAPKFDTPVAPSPLGKFQPQAATTSGGETVCPGGEVLPPGMPMSACPTHGATGDGSGNQQAAASTGDGQPGPHEKLLNPTKEDVRARRLGGDLQVASTEKDEEGGLPRPYLAGGQGGGSLLGGGAQSGGQPQTALGAAMVATETAKATAKFYPNQDFMLAKGQLPDCTLRTAIRTSVPGFIQCTLSAPVWSMNGKVVLMEAGTVVNGEYNQGVTAGQKAIFTYWTDARTPSGVSIALGSPGTDQLGRAGTDGYIDNKWMERYAGAVFYSLFDDMMNIELAKANQNSGSNNIALYPSSQGTGKAIVEEMLKQGAAIKPDLYKNQGEVIKIFIARDVDFSTVYQLRSRRKEF